MKQLLGSSICMDQRNGNFALHRLLECEKKSRGSMTAAGGWRTICIERNVSMSRDKSEFIVYSLYIDFGNNTAMERLGVSLATRVLHVIVPAVLLLFSSLPFSNSRPVNHTPPISELYRLSSL